MSAMTTRRMLLRLQQIKLVRIKVRGLSFVDRNTPEKLKEDFMKTSINEKTFLENIKECFSKLKLNQYLKCSIVYLYNTDK